MKSLTLNSGNKIPILGLGTWQLQGDQCVESIKNALEIGFRHIDTADAYDNHESVKRGISNSGIKREELFITSKLWWQNCKKQDTLDACKRALDELGLDYLNMFLIHWPNRKIDINETIEAMEILKEDKLIHDWGVSNFTIHHLQDILDKAHKIADNQVEFHPTLNQKELKEFCDKNKIIMTAYSPIGRGEDLKLREIKELAEKYNKTESQIILNWLTNKNIVAIPKASSEEHIKENFESQDFEMDKEDLKLINGLNTDNRMVNPSFSDFEY